MIEHVVLFKFKSSTSKEEIAKIAEDLRALKGQIEGLIDLSIGENFSSRSKGFDAGLVVRLTDESALQTYQSHPEHVRILTEQLKPNLEDVVAVDYRF
ncbi:MAG: Dabb family protein [Oligoflexales bacterium]|nr:Dabb family protein [Oligoflexales bacterium]